VDDEKDNNDYSVDDEKGHVETVASCTDAGTLYFTASLMSSEAIDSSLHSFQSTYIV